MAIGQTQNIKRDFVQIVIFNLGEEEYAIEILKIQEIIRMPEKITKMPNIPDFIEGVINLRGEIVPIVNLHKKFNIECSKKETQKVMIINLDGQYIGIIVDGVSEVKTIPKDIIAEVPDMFSKVDYEYLGGVIKLEERLVILLKLENLFSAIELNLLNWVKNKIKTEQQSQSIS